MTIECRIVDNLVVVSVTDSGIGIKPEDIPFVFDRFYRVDNERTKDISGFGIGLYVSAEIIKLHGGSVGVESNYSVGSTFYFSIPL